jgi:4-hydroxybutyryl-CoA dehydratase/vinylacetyl-CoA-Delta-isomerase
MGEIILMRAWSYHLNGATPMALKTAEEYRESLRDLDKEVYVHGERVEGDVQDHPMIEPSVNAIAETYELANDPEYEDLMVAESHLTGEPVNRFTHIHQNNEDLVKKSKMNRVLGRTTGTCFQRCVGMDALNALSIVTHEIDEKYDTEYNDRFQEYLEFVQDLDATITGAMTDVKGDRSERPGDQEDPDMYLHVVEENDDGIVVRGAKAHQTGSTNSHEVIVMPTRHMREDDDEYAVSFAVPADVEGLKYIVGRHPNDHRQANNEDLDQGNADYAPMESLMVFDDVFVPWERVFMYREHEFAHELVEKFSSYHRQSYSCKAGVGDALIGATSEVAKANGVRDADHIQDKLVEMNHLNETLYSCSLACAHEGCEMNSGTNYVDVLLSNVTKLNVTRFPYKLTRKAQDIAGGLVATLPAEEDFENPETADYLEKYLQANPDVSTKERVRLLRLVENMTMGTNCKPYMAESLHGAGSPMAQRMMIGALEDMEEKEQAARQLAGIKEEE